MGERRQDYSPWREDNIFADVFVMGKQLMVEHVYVIKSRKSSALASSSRGVYGSFGRIAP
jgi:hypothetical protein